MANPIIHGAQIPGGEHSVAASPAKLADDDTPCKSITILSNSGNSRVFWGYDDMVAGSKRRGYIDAGGSVSISDTCSPSSIFIYGTAGNLLFWTSVRA